jgi:hypothetical protein
MAIKRIREEGGPQTTFLTLLMHKLSKCLSSMRNGATVLPNNIFLEWQYIIYINPHDQKWGGCGIVKERLGDKLRVQQSNLYSHP